MLFNNKYRTQSFRLKGYDYRTSGYYFITICTKDRLHYFGEIIDHKMVYNRVGFLMVKNWREIPQHFTFIKNDAFIVMPNHIHGILRIKDGVFEQNDFGVEALQCNASTNRHSQISPKKRSLSVVIRAYKSFCSKTINQLFPDMNFKWQSLYYEEIIKDDYHLYNTRQYIINNVKNWDKDRNNQE